MIIMITKQLTTERKNLGNKECIRKTMTEKRRRPRQMNINLIQGNEELEESAA